MSTRPCEPCDFTLLRLYTHLGLCRGIRLLESLEYHFTRTAQPYTQSVSHADNSPPCGGLWGLIVGLSFDPATRVASQEVSSTLVVDEDEYTERHWSQPPRPPEHTAHNLSTVGEAQIYK